MTNDNASKKVGEIQLNNSPVPVSMPISASNSLPLPIEAEILEPVRLIADPEPGISVPHLGTGGFFIQFFLPTAPNPRQTYLKRAGRLPIVAT